MSTHIIHKLVPSAFSVGIQLQSYRKFLIYDTWLNLMYMCGMLTCHTYQRDVNSMCHNEANKR